MFIYPNGKYGSIPKNIKDIWYQLNLEKHMVSAIEDISGEWPDDYFLMITWGPSDYNLTD